MFKTICLSIAILFSTLAMPQAAEAGPLLDWLRGLRQRRVCNTCTPRTVANYAPAQANPMGLQPGQCARTCMKTCSRTVVNYVPQTCYRTAWNRVPVTQYRPVTNSDPCTGCTVTCMRPCTTYTWQMRRVPYTTYRPVYRQESYRVPVTTITNDCATGNCATCPTGTCGIVDGCSTCGVPGTTTMGTPTLSTPSPATTTDGVYYTDPAGNRLDTSGGFQVPSSVPADNSPSLVDPSQTSAPSVLQRMQETATTWPQAPSNIPRETVRPVNNRQQSTWQNQPARIDMDDMTAEKASPLRERWSYSPVRLASYSKPVEPAPTASREFETVSGELTSLNRTAPVLNKQKHTNSGWSAVEW